MTILYLILVQVSIFLHKKFQLDSTKINEVVAFFAIFVFT